MNQVEEIKNKTDIVGVVSEYVKLVRSGRNLKGLCPFHGEKTPSFMVNPELQIYKCFGCQEGGDVYSFLQKMEGMEFGEALQMLAKRAGITLESYQPSQAEQVKERLIKINGLAQRVYHYLLMGHKSGKTALDYVRGRGVSDESIEKFGLGYAPDSWNFLGDFLTKKKNFEMRDVVRAGIVVEGKNYDRFRGRLMFPLANARGQIVGFAGRVLPSSNDQTPNPNQGGKYINTPETEIYHKSDLLYGLDVTRGEIKREGWVVAVEGQMDVIASFQAGVRNVVGIGGTALTERQVEVLRRLVDTVVLALDADVAGDMAARRGIEVADKAGLLVKIVRLHGVKDPGEMATSDPEGWKKAVGEAIPVYDFYIESAVGRWGLEVEGKARIGRELAPIWAKISDEIVQAHYVKKLAGVLGVDEEAVRGQVAKIGKPSFAPSASLGATEGPSKSRREVMEEYIVGLAVRYGRIKELGEAVGMIKTKFWQRVVSELGEGKGVTGLSSELKERVYEATMVGPEVVEDEIDHEWGKAIIELEEADIRERLRAGEGTARLTKRLAELTKER